MLFICSKERKNNFLVLLRGIVSKRTSDLSFRTCHSVVVNLRNYFIKTIPSINSTSFICPMRIPSVVDIHIPFLCLETLTGSLDSVERIYLNYFSKPSGGFSCRTFLPEGSISFSGELSQ